MSTAKEQTAAEIARQAVLLKLVNDWQNEIDELRSGTRDEESGRTELLKILDESKPQTDELIKIKNQLFQE